MEQYDIGIIGAGVAGCSLAILLAKAGRNVVLFEKEEYPKHKVCGEFISNESYDFFTSLGLPLDEWDLPKLKNLVLTSESGLVVQEKLKKGGFGLSRYKMDEALSKLCIDSGVTFYEKEKVIGAEAKKIKSTRRSVTAELIIGAHGKYNASYHNIESKKASRNFVGVKYHIKGDFKDDQISLHSFDGGYCGMSKVEGENYCLCYLVDATKLKEQNNKIGLLEQNVLFKNEHLKKIYNTAEFIWDKPCVVSNVKFNKQTLATNDLLFLGDASGAISPLSGNGMSMAARSAYELSKLILTETNFEDVRKGHEKNWDRHFKSRVNKAEILNTIMLKPSLHHWVLKFLKVSRYARTKIVNDMQGDTFNIKGSILN